MAQETASVAMSEQLLGHDADADDADDDYVDAVPAEKMAKESSGGFKAPSTDSYGDCERTPRQPQDIVNLARLPGGDDLKDLGGIVAQRGKLSGWHYALVCAQVIKQKPSLECAEVLLIAKAFEGEYLQPTVVGHESVCAGIDSAVTDYISSKVL